MKLLLDHNLSPRLAKQWEKIFGTVIHVRDLGFSKTSDNEIWHYAGLNDFAIVTKDKDFYQRSAAFGAPPKIIHLTCGNCKVARAAGLLIERKGHVLDFLAHPTKAYLAVG